jgi:hypothetical protein
MTNLHKVAERIGIRSACELAYPKAYRDGEEIVCLDGDLRHYLLTGDRPLRIIVAYRLAICPHGDGWVAYNNPHTGDEAATAAEAILACAEGVK